MRGRNFDFMYITWLNAHWPCWQFRVWLWCVCGAGRWGGGVADLTTPWGKGDGHWITTIWGGGGHRHCSPSMQWYQIWHMLSDPCRLQHCSKSLSGALHHTWKLCLYFNTDNLNCLLIKMTPYHVFWKKNYIIHFWQTLTFWDGPIRIYIWY